MFENSAPERNVTVQAAAGRPIYEGMGIGG